MDLLQQLHSISKNCKLSTKTKKALISGFKQSLQLQLAQSKKVLQPNKNNNMKQLADSLDKNIKNISHKILKTQMSLLTHHRLCMQKINCPFQEDSQKICHIKQLSGINDQLRSLLKQIQQKKSYLSELSKEVQGHYVCKKIRMQIQGIKCDQVEKKADFHKKNVGQSCRTSYATIILSNKNSIAKLDNRKKQNRKNCSNIYF